LFYFFKCLWVGRGGGVDVEGDAPLGFVRLLALIAAPQRQQP
jgi:hypothetical protein